MKILLQLIIDNSEIIFTAVAATIIRHFEKKKLVNKFTSIINKLNDQVNEQRRNNI
jgi:hypothetical protein